MATVNEDPDLLPDGLLDLQAPVVFVPVRHHSPACSRMVRALLRELQPAAVLIEGPADFNARADELLLPHRLPIAIYSYARWASHRGGAYYPFCTYSPEWTALRTAAEMGTPFRFIDIPWAHLGRREASVHRYTDGSLRSGDYIAALCRRIGVDDFDAAWDVLFEIPQDEAPREVFARVHHFCSRVRQLHGEDEETDRRERFMAAAIRRAQEEFPGGRLVVVTGGLHSAALYRLWTAPGEAVEEPPKEEEPPLEEGVTLTPYSYERLDSLTGYEAGMPNPGFYHAAWEAAEAGRSSLHRGLLTAVAEEVRRRGQTCSTADLIAVETTARALAQLRGHERVWRRDLVDGIVGALVKDELELGVPHPFVEAIHQVFRGGERGWLAEGAVLPPLVHDIRRLLVEMDLQPRNPERRITLDLFKPEDRVRSQFIHALRALEIPAFTYEGGTDLVQRDDLSEVIETWRIRWTPEFESSCIEAARFGPTVEDAVLEALGDRARRLERDAAGGALLLLESHLMGVHSLAASLQERLAELIRQDGDFLNVGTALGHLLYLYRYDELLGAAGNAQVATLLQECWERALWLLEGLSGSSPRPAELLRGIVSLQRTLDHCRDLPLSRTDLISVFQRIAGSDAHDALLRGAAGGGLWSMGEADRDLILQGLQYCGEPDRLGDYLTGLFGLARESIQREPELVLGIDALLMAYSDEQFLEASPALRLAFSYFTPREKHHLATNLLRALGLEEAPLAAPLTVDAEEAEAALAHELRIFRSLERYGLRGREYAGR